MIMPIHAIRLSKIKRRKKLPPDLLKNSNSLPLTADLDGGDERARTADLLVANQALSRLSYIPTSNRFRDLPATMSLRGSAQRSIHAIAAGVSYHAPHPHPFRYGGPTWI